MASRKNIPSVGALMTTKEVAARLRTTTDHVTRLALRGELPSLKLGTRPGKRGGRRLFPADEIERWIAAHVARA